MEGWWDGGWESGSLCFRVNPTAVEWRVGGWDGEWESEEQSDHVHVSFCVTMSAVDISGQHCSEVTSSGWPWGTGRPSVRAVANGIGSDWSLALSGSGLLHGANRQLVTMALLHARAGHILAPCLYQEVQIVKLLRSARVENRCLGVPLGVGGCMYVGSEGAASSVEATPTHTPVEKITPARCGCWQHWKVVDDGPCELHDESRRADEVPRASVVH